MKCNGDDMYSREEFGEFLLKEKKDGTKIMVRDVQLALLEMMKDIDKICRDNNIEYCLTGGSTLGAYLYKGFIPWDDDLDIAMMRKDYKKFIKALEKDLDKEKYTFHCFEKNKKYDVTWPYMKIRKKNTYIKEVNKLLPNRCDDCNGIFIDVFIYDYMAKSTILDLPLRLCNSVLMPIIIFFENLKLNPIPLKWLYRFNAKLYGKIFNGSKYIGDDLTWTYRNPMTPLRYEKAKMFPAVLTPFEDTMLPVPNDTRDYLIRHWTERCLTPLPPEKRKPGHVFDISLTSSTPEE